MVKVALWTCFLQPEQNSRNHGWPRLFLPVHKILDDLQSADVRQVAWWRNTFAKYACFPPPKMYDVFTREQIARPRVEEDTNWRKGGGGEGECREFSRIIYSVVRPGINSTGVRFRAKYQKSTKNQTIREWRGGWLILATGRKKKATWTPRPEGGGLGMRKRHFLTSYFAIQRVPYKKIRKYSVSELIGM